MREFLTTLKGKVIAGIVTVCVVAAVAVGIIITNSGYRTIVVDELNGITNIINNSKNSEAFVGQHLKSGDDVTVTAGSDLTLVVDSDKHLFAEENSHFWIEAKGKEGNTKTDIHIDEGSNLYRIDQKLNDAEEFNVDTPNSTMSVRGTVFRVSVTTDAIGEIYTLIEVFEGEVFVEAKYEEGSVTGESKSLFAGERAIIHSNTNISEFLKSDDGKDVSEIDYFAIPQNTAIALGKAIDDGRKLSITKELLFDNVGLKKHVFELSGDFEVCTVCGLRQNAKSLEIAVPKDEKSEEKHQHEFEDKWTVLKAATCLEDGLSARQCKSCDEKEEKVVKALGHDFGELQVIYDSTENTNGLLGKLCKRCNAIKEDETIETAKKKPKKIESEIQHVGSDSNAEQQSNSGNSSSNSGDSSGDSNDASGGSSSGNDGNSGSPNGASGGGNQNGGGNAGGDPSGAGNSDPAGGNPAGGSHQFSETPGSTLCATCGKPREGHN